MGRFVRRNPLVAFFVLSYLLMWSLASLAVFGILKVSEHPILYILGSWTPTIAAVIVIGTTNGQAAVKSLLGGWLKWRISAWWYLATLLPIILFLVVGGLYTSFLGDTSGPKSSFVFPLFLELVIFNMLLGPSGEEAGWRGFALPRLQGRFTALTATLILGLIWAIWHIPMWFMPDRPEGQIPFWLYIVDTLATSIALTWVYNSTDGSLLAAGLLHLAQNLTTDINAQLGLMPLDIGYFTVVAIDVVLAITVVIFAGPVNLSRKPEIPRITATPNAAQPTLGADSTYRR